MTSLPSGRVVDSVLAKRLEARRTHVAPKPRSAPRKPVRLAESRFGRLVKPDVLDMAAEWNEVEAARISERNATHARNWREANPERWRETLRRWQRENRARWIKWPQRPAWADRAAIREIYSFARLTGMHVDHVIPLNGAGVSGLHIASNLQLLPPAVNMSKGNRHAV